MPDAMTFDTFIREQARALRARDSVPTSLAGWQARRARLRQAMFDAMGPFPAKPAELAPRVVRTLPRKGYRIENILLQTRPDVWATCTAYVPESVSGKVPAVLVVHGHWAGARRDPVVQARCLGLVKLGFFVLALDAFSAGERHPTIARGSYHGALLGSTLWPTGLSLLGVQVYDNRRAVDYLLTRPEVDGTKLGITGASGGGNQSMYAGALDERFGAVVPVCSVGTYQAYLRAACCVCEVLPGALRFTEEGEVLGLVAPRALLVINASKDALQFSIGEAKKSLETARAIARLYGTEGKIAHATFESPHDYNKAMRETMYGWMTRWLKNQGDGKPIPEPAHDIEKPEDLACYPDGSRPAGFVFAPDLAARQAKQLLAWHTEGPLDHKEAWDARAVLIRGRLEEALGGLPKPANTPARTGTAEEKDGVRTTPLTLKPEAGLEVTAGLHTQGGKNRGPACVLLHLDGQTAALAHPLARALLDRGRSVFTIDLRGTGAAQPRGDAIGGAPDHNSCEHALWIGRPLLGQWVADVRALLDHSRAQSVIGLGQAGVVAVAAAGLFPDRVRSLAIVDSLLSYLTPAAYPPGTRMGLLAPGILRAGDVPHLAALAAPRKLIVAGGFGPGGKKLDAKGLRTALGFTRTIYDLVKAGPSLVVRTDLAGTELVDQL